MKIRQGYVSNSSSSSFVCDITGEATELYDGAYEEGFAYCVHGHTFMTDGFQEVEDWVNKVLNGEDLTEEEENFDGEYDVRTSIPENICPICNGKAKPQIIERLKTMMTSLNVTIEDLQ